MTQLFVASTLFGAVTLGAAIDGGHFDSGLAQDAERVLVVSANAGAPETTCALDEEPAFGALRHHFGRIVDWNAAIAPYHPSVWTTRPADRVLWKRYLREHWQLRTPVTELVIESVAVPPARTLCEIFDGSALTVYADGLMSYGPTRNRLDRQLAGRITRLLHPDLVPGVAPLLLAEFGVPRVVIDDAMMRHEFALVEKSTPPFGAGPGGDSGDGSPAPAMILGQYLAALGIVTEAEEEELHAGMLRALAAGGHHQVVFKPHPLAPARLATRLAAEAARAGMTFRVLDAPVPAEVCFARIRPALVAGCFSTALATAAQYFDIPVARFGTELVLSRLTPYQNSNRVPATLVDAVVPALDGEADLVAPDLVPGLLATVGYCMQPSSYPFLRAPAIEFLRWHRDERTARYVRRRRLTSLDLPGRDGLLARARAEPRRVWSRGRTRVRSVSRAGGQLARAVVRG